MFAKRSDIVLNKCVTSVQKNKADLVHRQHGSNSLGSAERVTLQLVHAKVLSRWDAVAFHYARYIACDLVRMFLIFLSQVMVHSISSYALGTCVFPCNLPTLMFPHNASFLQTF